MPDVIAIGVAKGVVVGYPDIAELANETLALMGLDATVTVDDVEVDDRWMGDDYAVPTAAGDAAIHWAARHGGWLMDRTYSGKGLSGLLGRGRRRPIRRRRRRRVHPHRRLARAVHAPMVHR